MHKARNRHLAGQESSSEPALEAHDKTMDMAVVHIVRYLLQKNLLIL